MFRDPDIDRLLAVLNISNEGVVSPKPECPPQASELLQKFCEAINQKDTFKAIFVQVYMHVLQGTNQIPVHILSGLKQDLAPIKEAKEVINALNPYFNWRTDNSPIFSIPPLFVPVSHLINLDDKQKEQVTEFCIHEYKQSMAKLELSVGEVALKYITKDTIQNQHAMIFLNKYRHDPKVKTSAHGPLINFANVFSQRYFDLLQGYIAWEIKNHIPMLPIDAGQLKNFGFTSAEIIQMNDLNDINSADAFVSIEEEISTLLNNNQILRENFLKMMSNQESTCSRDDFILDSDKALEYLKSIDVDPVLYEKLKNQTKAYKELPAVDLLDRAIFLMIEFGHLTPSEISSQFYSVAIMRTNPTEKSERRLQMEIRHRVAGDGTGPQISAGTLGSNPLAYLNLLRDGEYNHPEAEFRNKMYFVYMLNHFANAVLIDDKIIEHINAWLNTNNKGWQLDIDFIEAMRGRGKKYLPEIFRYGAFAGLNPQLRTARTTQEAKKFMKENPNISIAQAMEGTADKEAIFNLPLSKRELLNQTGQLDWNPHDKNRPDSLLNFKPGVAVFHLTTHETASNISDAAREYLKQIKDLHLPVYAGISGTLDQSTAMAGLVGLGIDSNPEVRKQELETIRLAYLAFMLPGRDHSIHEIMQSSATYGLDYIPGPAVVDYIYPIDSTSLKTELTELQKKRGTNLPSYFLSREFIDEAAKKVSSTSAEQTASAPEVSVSKPILFKHQKNDKHRNVINISLANTLLSQMIQNNLRKCSVLNNINSQDLHITIGSFEQALSLKQVVEYHDRIATIFGKYWIKVSATDVEARDNGRDLVLILKDSNNSIGNIKKELSELFANDNNMTFKCEPQLHVKIAHSNGTPLNSVHAKAAFPITKCTLETFTLEQAGLMRYNQRLNKYQIDTLFSSKKPEVNAALKHKKN